MEPLKIEGYYFFYQEVPETEEARMHSAQIIPAVVVEDKDRLNGAHILGICGTDLDAEGATILMQPHCPIMHSTDVIRLGVAIDAWHTLMVDHYNPKPKAKRKKKAVTKKRGGKI